MQVRRFADPTAFLDRAESFLMQAEAENTLILGIRDVVRERNPKFGGDCYWATVEDADGVIACAVRTPPFGVLLTRARSAAVESLVTDIAEKYETLPGVLGPEPGVSQFAERWSSRTRTPARPRMRQRLFEAREVQRMPVRPPGALRMALEADLPIIMDWAVAFHEEARVGTPADPRISMQQQVAQQSVFMWDTGRPVCMAGCGRTARWGRIGCVYTPPDERRRGFASACVADLTERVLNDGRAFCSISTDLSNPTTNKIYQAIGYRPVCDVTDFDLNAG